MLELSLEGHQGQRTVIDLCHPCQVFWFDAHESPRLTPGSTLRLFRTIGEQIGVQVGEQTARPHAVGGDSVACPRCGVPLRRTRDMQRATRFEYLKCPNEHGRLTGFFDFLKEKHFIRTLSAEQIDTLRRQVQTVNCSNCGGPIDLTHQTACGHCASPLSMLDLSQAEAIVHQLQRAEDRTNQPVDPALPLELARARREVSDAFGVLERDLFSLQDASSAGLVGAGLGALARWLSRRV